MAIFLIILLVGLILRGIYLDQSFWLDEAISAIASRDSTYSGIIFDFSKIDNHPPLFYLFLKLWGEVFGFGDTNLRLLSVLIGAGVIPITYRIAINLSKSRNIALTVALMSATSPLLVYYSQEVRMYMLITFFASLQILIFTEILKKEAVWKWVLFSAVNCLLFFSDYITVFLFPVFFVYALISNKTKLFKQVLLSFSPLLFFFILWYPLFNEQLLINNNLVKIFPGWKEVIGGATLKNSVVFFMKLILGRISFEPKIVYYSLVGIFSIPVVCGLYQAFKDRRNNVLLFLWFFIPVILGFSFSFFIPVFNYFRFIYVLPALIILTTIGISKYRLRVKYLLFGFIFLGNVVGLSVYYLDPSQHRENWKQVVSFIEKNGKADDLVIFEFHEPFAPYRWYFSGRIDAIGGTDTYFADKEKTYLKLGKSLKAKTGVYYFEYLRDLSDPNRYIEQKLMEEGFAKGEVYDNFYNIGQIIYWSR